MARPIFRKHAGAQSYPLRQAVHRRVTLRATGRRRRNRRWFARLPRVIRADNLRISEERWDEAYKALAIINARSAVRTEYPHSLSYQAMTLTIVPFMTMVEAPSMIDERGSPLKDRKST